MSWKKYFKTYDGMPEKMPRSSGGDMPAMQIPNDIVVGYLRFIRDNLIVYKDMVNMTKWI